MELNCPQCAAHFLVPDGAIGPKGRKLKCAKCGHTWRQMPPEQDVPASAATPDVMPEMEAPAPSAPPPPPEEDMAAAMPPVEDGPPVPMEMEPGKRQNSAPPEAGELPLSSDRESAGLGEDDDPLAGLDFGDSDLSGLDDLAEPGRDDRRGGEPDLDDFLGSDPEPIPDMFSRDGSDDDDGLSAQKKGKLGSVLLGLVVVLGLIGGGLYMARSQVVRLLPQAEPLYAALGIPVDALGVGLRFNDVTSERLVRDGTDTLVVRGFIANTTDTPRDVPYLRLALFDATDAVVQDMVAEPPQLSLDGGATTGFRIQLENPSAAARRFEVDWTQPPGSDP